MSRRRRLSQAGAGAVLAATLLAGCTSENTATPSSVALTPGGSMVSIPSTSAVVSTARSTPGLSTTLPTSSAPTAGASTSRTAPPTSSSRTSTSKAPTKSPTTAKPTLPVVSTAGLSKQEIADRAAIQAVWSQFWDLYVVVRNRPAATRAALLSPITANPIKQQIIDSGIDFDKNGWATFGSVQHRIYWGPSINGKSPAIMGDCLNTSNYGSMVKSTKKVRSRGVPRGNVHGVFVRGSDGHWRLEQLQLLPDTPC
ncbi:hypothetical protein SAMN04515671_2839 [Nakamurella panacisegetis]|uniref:Mce-associated membrane protein n=1 Tax=Nakamurella panacisegetis TaxID=1090615 RepID=A0A1H0PNG3_9ACTN|nr:hypothetical protein SAMN04515671_2839 [Nakamurella panacisegetis]